MASEREREPGSCADQGPRVAGRGDDAGAARMLSEPRPPAAGGWRSMTREKLAWAATVVAETKVAYEAEPGPDDGV